MKEEKEKAPEGAGNISTTQEKRELKITKKNLGLLKEIATQRYAISHRSLKVQ
ncbi:MAG: hypothetical protein FWG63_03025 [Defluviitaleaceae bacterium]|nr:hypothetical protein [Defluviitaleaceae bacterium]